MKRFIHVVLSIAFGVLIITTIIFLTALVVKFVAMFGIFNFIKWCALGTVCLFLVSVASVSTYQILSDWKCFSEKENKN